ncbi:helix-turn-helix transcriptional regulator [Piscirickettsia litoralis]|uniref:helix-turn-helix transcriptional regulator n=1 Tax=Piscirickettsia litoralis TaxID=1891921 RepID=UPI0013012CAF
MEHKCLTLLLDELSYTDIATVLDISRETVKTHIENIKLKSNIKSKKSLIEYFKFHDLISI